MYLPSSPVPAKMMNVPPNLLSPVTRAAQPWVEFFDSSTHEYGVLTPEQLVCEFKAVMTIKQSMAELLPLKTFSVPVNGLKLESTVPVRC